MAKAKNNKKKTLSNEEATLHKIKKNHQSMVRDIFRATGFVRINGLADREFTFKNSMTDFDDVFVHENILVCAEYTTSASHKVGEHLKGKKIPYDIIIGNKDEFVDFYCGLDFELKKSLLDKYTSSEVEIVILYCSRNNLDIKYQELITEPIYLNYPELRYFKNLTDCIKKSALQEFLHFMKIEPQRIGANGKMTVSVSTQKYTGTVLPENNSNFEKGYKVVSFYVDPESLLSRAYVLRKDGWRDSDGLYQRMISKNKIDLMRKYLKKEKRVFVNNIIATLDSDTKILDKKGDTVNPANITSTQPVDIQIATRMNSIGLVDGQHRTYSYYESANDDADIAKLRSKQNLLVTGIIYPENTPDIEKEKFEARLFLEINSTQTNAKSNLKQAIGLVLDPFSTESIATKVLMKLDASSGPLSGQIERYWFDSNKLKPTSIVSYGLKPLVKTSGQDSLFSLWNEPSKILITQEGSHSVLNNYVSFCVAEINKLVAAAKDNLDSSLWTVDKSVKGRMLTTTNINALLICLRLLIENRKASDFETYKTELSGLTAFNFKDYHSSQYGRMAEAIYNKYFA